MPVALVLTPITHTSTRNEGKRVVSKPLSTKVKPRCGQLSPELETCVTEAGDDCGDGADLRSSGVGNMMRPDSLRWPGVDVACNWVSLGWFLDVLYLVYGGGWRGFEVGSNNINLFVPSGQFGTRLQGGKEPRIFGWT